MYFWNFLQVSWVRYRDTSLLSVGKFVYISDRRFKVLHEVNSSDWFLVIKSVTYNDEGIYECQVNSDPYKTFKFHLSVVGEYILFYFQIPCKGHKISKNITPFFWNYLLSNVKTKLEIFSNFCGLLRNSEHWPVQNMVLSVFSISIFRENNDVKMHHHIRTTIWK